MYVKRAQVHRGRNTYSYLKLVESYREGGRARQRVVANLGREDELKASGQLNALAGALARLDPPLVGQRRDVGPLLVVAAVLERLGLAGIVGRHLPEHRRSQLSPAEVVVALIANRLASPSPLYDVAGWASASTLAEVFAIPPMLLNDDRLGRVLDDFAPVAEAVRGAVMLAAIEAFGIDPQHACTLTSRRCGWQAPTRARRWSPRVGGQPKTAATSTARCSPWQSRTAKACRSTCGPNLATGQSFLVSARPSNAWPPCSPKAWSSAPARPSGM